MRTELQAAQDIIRRLYRADLLRHDKWVESEVERIIEDELKYFHQEFTYWLDREIMTVDKKELEKSE